MAINFPSNPTNAQEVTEGNVTYVYNATKGYWESSEVSSGGASIDVFADMATLIAKTGMSNGDQAFVTGNNNLYIYSGTGWYKVATVQNDAPSAITGVNGTYELAIDGTPTVITAVSTDPEGFPLTWSYSTTGLGSIATVSQADNVFTITPSTTEADAGIFSLTLNATDGVNGAVSTNTSITLQFFITNIKYTTLLATAVDTSDNSNITDSSTNNHTITVIGDANAGTFSPYRSGGYSTYFDGSGDYITTPSNTSFDFGTGDFTIEAWIYPTALSGNHLIVDTYVSGDNGSYQLYWRSTGNSLAFYTPGDGVFLQDPSSSNIVVNTWNHVAVSRSGTSAKLFVNGTVVDTVTNSRDLTHGNALAVGAQVATGTNYFSGFITDVRIVKGTAVYTSAFTPPTETLTAVSGTSLLTCHLPYIADGSSNDHSITVNGNTSTKPFSPYDYQEYTVGSHGGSINFDGTGDYLTIPDHSSLNFASNDWTIECWIYPRTNVGDCGIWHQSASGGTDWFSLYLDGSFNPKFVLKNNNAEEWAGTAAANTAPQNTWTHIALVRRFGTDIKLYANGKVVHTETQHLNVALENKTYNHVIGYERFVGNGTYFDGLISDFKMDIGTAHYTGEFTPPTAPLSSSGADMHIKGTDASIIDKSQGANLKLVGNTTGSTTQVKFADTKSMYFDGSGDYVSISEDDKFNISGDFTIESWIWPSNSTLSGIFGTGNGSFGSDAVVLTWRHGTVNDQFSFWVNNISSSSQILNSNITSTNTWTHIAIVRLGSTITLYQNGTSVDTYTSSGTFNLSHSGLKIGSYWGGTFNGYIQDFRITNGLARYTANFTPPTEPLKG
jgi:hypothetical protein